MKTDLDAPMICPMCGGKLTVKVSRIHGCASYSTNHVLDEIVMEQDARSRIRCHFGIYGCRTLGELIHRLNVRRAYLVYDDFGQYEDVYQVNVAVFMTREEAVRCADEHERRMNRKMADGEEPGYNFTEIKLVDFVDR